MLARMGSLNKLQQTLKKEQGEKTSGRKKTRNSKRKEGNSVNGRVVKNRKREEETNCSTPCNSTLVCDT